MAALRNRWREPRGRCRHDADSPDAAVRQLHVVSEAHYADAITVDLLKTEQGRIRASLHAITTRLDELATTYDKAKVGLDTILSILTDLGDLYAKAEPAERRMLNQALFDRIILEDDDTATITPKQAIATILASDPSPHNERTLPGDHAGQGSNVQLYVDLGVDAMERCGNRRPRVERLVSAWDQGPEGSGEPDSEPDDPLIGAAAEPRRRPRTRLTVEEVDAMRTARINGVSVTALAKQFGVHRGTVWTTTRIKSP